MIPRITPIRDARDASAILNRFWDRRYGYVPEWIPPDKTAGIAIGQIFSRMIYTILQRLNQAPAKNKLAFLDMLGLHLIPAQEARAPIIFQMGTPGNDSSAPAGTQLAAPPPPGSSDQIVFETERATGIAAAKLTELVSLWPGRDQYLNHAADYLAGLPITLFDALHLQPTPHVLYLAHAAFLAFAGTTHLEVEFNLEQGSSQALEILWQYWDGKVWRGFKSLKPNCLAAAEKGFDGTNGLMRSGSVRLDTDCAKTAPTAVNGIQSYWIRGQLTQPLPADPAELLPVVETMKLRTRIDQDLEGIIAITVQPPKPALSVLSLTGGPSGVAMSVNISSTDPNFNTVSATTDTNDNMELKQNFTQGKNYTLQILDPQGAVVSNFQTTYSGPTGQAQQVDIVLTGGQISSVTFSTLPSAGNVVALTTEAGALLADVSVSVTSPDDTNFMSVIGPTDQDGILPLGQSLSAGKTYSIDVTYLNTQASGQIKYDGTIAQPLQFSVTLKINGLRLDKAICEGRVADVTKPFFPFGQQPQPGAVFYFNQQETFSKPEASVRIYASRTQSPQDKFQIGDAASEIKLDHIVNWEYWNGDDWASLPVSSESSDGALDLDATEILDFVVPKDMAATSVNNQDGLWMRVRLVSGGFGFTKEVVFNDGAGHSNNFTYVITRPPVLADFRIGYSWQTPAVPFDEVLAYNDFQFEDHTDDARWPGKTFSPYQPIGEVTPALYLGFDKPLPVNDFGIYFDIEEQSGVVEGPPLVWEYFNGAGWRELTVADETRALRLPGILSFIAPDDSVALARFKTPLHWVRGRLKEDGPPGKATLDGIYPNATWASQRRTFKNFPLGASTGAPSQAFVFTQIPVLAGEQIEVRELSGARANVEWRILALELSQGDAGILAVLEAALAREGIQTDIVEGNLRLKRDRNKRVTEAWVRWQGQPHLFFSGPNDRHYVLDQATGRLFFGDGVQGKIPPAAAAINARQFQSGGGLSGNLAARTITQLLGSIGGVQAVFNARAAEGGADGETVEAFSQRAPQSIRHRGRAITPPDYETLAQEASAGVAIARAVSGRDSAGEKRPGWITVMIIPQSQEDRPVPSYGLREEIRLYLESRAPADIAAAHQIEVAGPDYLPIDVEATLAPDDVSQAGAVEQAAHDALAEFLHPLRGGPDGKGWDLGRGVFVSDVARVLGEVAGVDYVEQLSLSVNGNLQGDRVPVPEDHIVVAGTLRLKLVVAAGN